MRNLLRHLKLLIIDEVSMLSSLNLAYIHLRLEEVFGGDTWFGSVNVLFVGDLLQLPPVNGRPVFEKVVRKAILAKLGCMMSVNIWQETVTYDELTINECQKKDREYCDLLDEVRRGCPSSKTVTCCEIGSCRAVLWTNLKHCISPVNHPCVCFRRASRANSSTLKCLPGWNLVLSRFSVWMRSTRPPVQRSSPRKPRPNLTGSTRRTAT